VRKNSELFKASIVGGDIWKSYLDSLSQDQLAAAQSDLAAIAKEVRNYLENVQAAECDIAQRLIEIAEERERSQRKSRREKVTKSLRCFLSEPAKQTDELLSVLHLCTKTGAAVRLDALTFTIVGKQQEVSSVNVAKTLFQQKHECQAFYHLYYIRDGRRSAGFGWDRPFLDELFLG